MVLEEGINDKVDLYGWAHIMLHCDTEVARSALTTSFNHARGIRVDLQARMLWSRAIVLQLQLLSRTWGRTYQGPPKHQQESPNYG